MTAIQGGGNASARSGSREARPGAEPWPSLAWQAPRRSAERRAPSVFFSVNGENSEGAAVPRKHGFMDYAPTGAPPPSLGRASWEWLGKTRAPMRRENDPAFSASGCAARGMGEGPTEASSLALRAVLH